MTVDNATEEAPANLRWWTWAPIAWIALACTSLLGSDLGPWKWPLLKASTLAGLTVATAMLAVFEPTAGRRLRLLLPAVVGAALLLILDAGWDVRLVAAGWIVALACGSSRMSALQRTPLLAAAAFPALRMAWPLAYAGHRALEDRIAGAPAALLADVVPAHFSRPLDLGPTASGLPILALGIAVCVAIAPRRPVRATVAGLVVVAAWLAYPLIIPDIDYDRDATLYFSRLPLLAAAVLTVVTMVAAGTGARAVTRRLPAWTLSLGVIVGLALGAVSTGALPLGSSLGPSRVAVLNRGGLDWQRPRYGRFGDFSGGMFGVLPYALRHEGHEVEVIDDDTITPGDLSGVDVLLLINCPKEWSDDEAATLDRYMRAGGDVLVLGDHTDVFGLMSGFNTLIDRYGIRFRFDSAYHARAAWAGCQDAPPDAWARGFLRRMPGIAIGAALDVQSPARVLLDARYAFSDEGMRDNVIGSFLGNYSFDPDERLGDLPLIATAAVGAGRIVVYGDTSSFQNGSVAYRLPREILPLLGWLTDDGPRLDGVFVRAVVGVLGLAALLAALLFGMSGLMLTIVTATCIAGAACGTAALARWSPPLRGSDQIAIIDGSLASRTGHYDIGGNTAGPLSTALQRGNLMTRWLDEFDPQQYAEARVIGLVAPQVAPDAERLDFYLDYMRRGGVIVAAAGGDDLTGLRPLIHRLGLDVLPRPLGPVPPEGRADRDEQPAFLSAFPIVAIDDRGVRARLIEGPDLEVAYRYGGDALVVFRRVDAGGLLLVGDSRFFSPRNVEGRGGYSRGNLRFIYELLHRYVGLADHVDVAFADPEDSP